jgi:hypothetical protein
VWANIAYIYWPIECSPWAWFVILSQVDKTTIIYWQIECILKLDLSGCDNLKELPSSIG